jgi:hypothetical protein
MSKEMVVLHSSSQNFAFYNIVYLVLWTVKLPKKDNSTNKSTKEKENVRCIERIEKRMKKMLNYAK